MSFFESIINLIKSLFGGKQETVQPSEQSASSSVTPDSRNVEGTNMRKSVFNTMVAGETDVAQKEAVKKQMQKMDAIGVYPYTISSDMWIYRITKPAEPLFTEYGTQYSATQKHK